MSTVAEAVGMEVRAGLARRRRTQNELAEVLGITPGTASRRLSGESPFDVVELIAIGAWLDVDPTSFIRSAVEQVAS